MNFVIIQGGANKCFSAGWGCLAFHSSIFKSTMGGKGSKSVKKSPGEPHRGVLSKTLIGHKDTVMNICFSPDGRYLASCSADKTIIIWDMRSMKPIHHISAHRAEVNAVCFSPDSANLLSCGRDSKASLWDVKNGQRVYSSRIARGPIMHCDYAKDTNKYFATGSEGGCVGIFEVNSTGITKKILEGHRDIVFQVCFSPDRVQLASCGNDRKIVLWNRGTGRILAKLKDKYSRVLTCQFNPDGTLIAAVVDGERVRIWNAITHEIVCVLEGHHHAPIISCSFSPNGELVATVSGDKTYALWNPTEPHPLPVFHIKAHDNWIQTVAFSPNGIFLATGSNDTKINLWI